MVIPVNKNNDSVQLLKLHILLHLKWREAVISEVREVKSRW